MAGVQWSAKLRLVDQRPQRGVAARQRDDHVDLVPRVAGQRLPEPGQLDEPEALGEREVLVEQPVAAEGAARVRDQRLVAREAHRLDRLAPEPLEPRDRAGRRRDEDAEAAAEDQLVELEGDLVAAGEEQVQPVQGDLLERERRRRAQPQAQDARAPAPPAAGC